MLQPAEKPPLLLSYTVPLVQTIYVPYHLQTHVHTVCSQLNAGRNAIREEALKAKRAAEEEANAASQAAQEGTGRESKAKGKATAKGKKK